MTTITTAGIGAVGFATNALLVQKLLEQTSGHQITINLVDPSPNPGPGDPYHSDIAWLNQPANRMSFDPKDIDAFTNFLKQTDPNANGDTFATRRQYGAFLKDQLKQLRKQTAQSSVTINTISEIGTDITVNGNTLALHTDSGRNINSDFIIAAPGHQRLGLFDQFSNIPNFFEPQFDGRQIQTILKEIDADPALPIAIIGTSQSFVDALAHQTYIDPSSELHAFSGRGILPWKFDPKEHPIGKDSAPYDFEHLTSIAVKNAHSGAQLQTLLKGEFDNARQHGIGPGIVLSRLQLKEFFQDAAQGNEQSRQAIQEFAAFYESYYGNMTPPSRYNAIQDLLQSGQLKVHHERLSPEKIEYDTRSGLFHIDGQNTPFRAVYNGAAYARTAINPSTGLAYAPLLKNAQDQDLLKISDDGKFFVSGQQKHPGLWLPTSPATETKWGMETFRSGIDVMTTNLIAQLG